MLTEVIVTSVVSTTCLPLTIRPVLPSATTNVIVSSTSSPDLKRTELFWLVQLDWIVTLIEFPFEHALNNESYWQLVFESSPFFQSLGHIPQTPNHYFPSFWTYNFSCGIVSPATTFCFLPLFFIPPLTGVSVDVLEEVERSIASLCELKSKSGMCILL
ncbi:protein of unknown function [Candidatus Nitrosacidococcus tergens]|uniref:Uncharacterized protein n=1 Tax=Candidatus Nitrosacidococcus tergens TaxID=553981 RepID=A0A7G1Q8W8_9GAMM|nr:protein of unknown function [Candidatus Nitrosacidococcus tergens]